MTDERRILEVLGRSGGGVGRHVAEIVKALDGDPDLSIDIAAPASSLVGMPKPVIDVDIPGGPVRGHRAAVRRLRSVFDDGYDVIHAHGLRAAIDAGLARRGTGIPLIATLHNLVHPEVSGFVKVRLYRRAEPIAVRLATRTFVPSKEMAAHLRAATPAYAERIEVLHAMTGSPPVASRDRAEVRTELKVPPDGHLIVTVARLHPQKALPVLLAAAAILGPKVVLAVVGDGPQRSELEALAGAEVKFLGYREDAADYIAAADIFCLSSVWEAVALAAQEAVLLGTPVVATAVGGLAELITDGVSGRLVPPDDPAALAVALRDTLASEELRREFADRALADYRRNFSREAVLARLKDVYLNAR